MGLFAAPEILWSPIINTLLLPWGGWKYSILPGALATDFGKGLLTFQFICFSLATITWAKDKNKIQNRIIFWLVLVGMVIINIFIILLLDTAGNFKPRPVL